MSPRFNLLDEPWLPVRLLDGRVCEVGLLEAFQRASEIHSLAETAPPSLVAQYRLLLAITHRALSCQLGRWKDRERAAWFREGLPQEAIARYLQQWREHFWLFHPEQPFMQVAALAQLEETRDKLKPWTQVSLASASGNNAAVLDHSVDTLPVSISPAFAVRTLLGYLQFVPPGLVKCLRDADKAGPLANTAAVLPLGHTLQQTLCLALHPAGRVDDLPSWERPITTRADLLAAATLASGPNDRYTRPTRAVLLRPQDGDSIQWLHFCEGLGLTEDVMAPDPMASWRAGSPDPVRLRFEGGRAFWRDLPALLPDPDRKMGHPATVLGWASSLHRARGDEVGWQSLLVAGVTCNPKRVAALLRWRSESLRLPKQALISAEIASHIRDCLEELETLHTKLCGYGVAALATSMPDPEHKDTRSRARALLDASGATPAFFAIAERGLPQLLALEASGDGDALVRHWAGVQLAAARAWWDQLQGVLGRTARALRAEAQQWPKFQGICNKLKQVAQPDHSKEEAVDEQH
ncbi:type I-E CRISPR-associated protein Cse1/CasA [Pseudomonas sp. NW5]|nr:type I-E CRISPR-associated protein Cse1/CasA [Pseudomonas sp. NW5]MCL7462699.1 type I-E CRISPR-associated protein Cse1/CasA [Pseudomonas sp. NW5]